MQITVLFVFEPLDSLSSFFWYFLNCFIAS